VFKFIITITTIQLQKMLTLPSHKKLMAELTSVDGYMLRWFICWQTVSRPNINLNIKQSALIETNIYIYILSV